MIVEVVDFGKSVDDEGAGSGQVASVHMRGTLGAGARCWSCCLLVYRWYYLGTGHGTKGHYVRDLGGCVEKVRRDCLKRTADVVDVCELCRRLLKREPEASKSALCALIGTSSLSILPI